LTSNRYNKLYQKLMFCKACPFARVLNPAGSTEIRIICWNSFAWATPR
jgi:hypothetical protein